MSYQSLYRRYRPRRFAEIRGQDHIVTALRNAVREGRVGHAYLFSGPRGTGKTSTARILAKVLNCAAPVDGEPDLVCESCLAIEAGTSFDVHELDAASNNKVDDIRDLIERVAFATPGRTKLYILDEVHMLSTAASAALLKTLEEPPPGVVFVLATTDPQKVIETIRSRTQHFEFHLLPAAPLEDYLRYVIDDAGLDVPADAIDFAVRAGTRVGPRRGVGARAGGRGRWRGRARGVGRRHHRRARRPRRRPCARGGGRRRQLGTGSSLARAAARRPPSRRVPRRDEGAARPSVRCRPRACRGAHRAVRATDDHPIDRGARRGADRHGRGRRSTHRARSGARAAGQRRGGHVAGGAARADRTARSGARRGRRAADRPRPARLPHRARSTARRRGAPAAARAPRRRRPPPRPSRRRRPAPPPTPTAPTRRRRRPADRATS